MANEEQKRAFLQRAATIAKIYRAILPDPLANALAPDAILLAYIGRKIRELAPPPDISSITADVENLLDDAIATRGYVINGEDEKPLVNLSEIDFENLQARFAKSRRHSQVERLKAQIDGKLQHMARLNRSRLDLIEKFQQMIEEYNAGSKNVEEFFAELLRFAQSLNEEERRGIKEGLTEEELALFDILTKPDPKLTKKEEAEVKRVCKALLETLKAEKLVLDWRNRQQSRAAVRLCIDKALDQLPEVYDEDLWQQKCELAYQHVFECYAGAGQNVYTSG